MYIEVICTTSNADAGTCEMTMQFVVLPPAVGCAADEHCAPIIRHDQRYFFIAVRITCNLGEKLEMSKLSSAVDASP